MKASEKIKGIVFAYNTTGEYDMVKNLGIEWLRYNVAFPWKDKMFGTLSEQYIADKEEITRMHQAGFEVMLSLPGLGGYVYDKDLDATVYKDEYPEFVGVKGTEEYYEKVRRSMEFVVEDFGENAGIYFQCGNEPDIETFSGDYPDDVIAGTIRAIADGVVRARPNARCGVNVASYNERAIQLSQLIYAPGHHFYYYGIDQYFGSWQPGTVEDWNRVIDAAYDRFGLPVLANEWGYSSAGEYQEDEPDPSTLPKGIPAVCYLKKWFHQVPGGHTPEVQAEYFRRGLQIFAENPRCIGSFMFCWRDAYHCYHCGAGDCPSEDFWGIVTKDLKPKPAFYTVKEALQEYYQ